MANATFKLPEALTQDPTEAWLKQLDEQLELLQPAVDRAAQLQEMRARLTGSTSTGRRPGRPTSSGRRSPQGSRSEEFIALVNQHPDGITIPEAAQQLDVAANYLYRVRNGAQAEGKVRVEGQKIYPATPQPVAVAS